jgi:hypothetical protein
VRWRVVLVDGGWYFNIKERVLFGFVVDTVQLMEGKQELAVSCSQ